MSDPERAQDAQDAERPKRSPLARFCILAAGWFFIVLGILGLFLPILQGILFLAIGAYLLSLESPRARRIIEKTRHRYPKLGRTFDAARLRAAHIIHRIGGRFR
jgi:uncharacterized membrane protein YbaN (DUF454 family)